MALFLVLNIEKQTQKSLLFVVKVFLNMLLEIISVMISSNFLSLRILQLVSIPENKKTKSS